MPLIFRKVYGDVNGKREVVRTIKISGRAAKKYSEMRERQREQRKEERTFKNLLIKLATPKINKVVESKVKEFALSTGGTYNDETGAVDIPIDLNASTPTKKQLKEFQAASDKRREEGTQTSRFNVDLGMPNLDLRRTLDERRRENTLRDIQRARGAQSDLTSMGLMGEGVNLNRNIDRTLGGLFNFRLF